MLLEQWDDEVAYKVWREEAMEEGEIKRAIKIAQKMKARGASINEILELTELTVEDVLKL